MSMDCRELDSHLSLELGGFFLRKMNVHAFVNSLDAQSQRFVFFGQEPEIWVEDHNIISFFSITFNVKYSRCFLSFIFYFKNAKMTHFPKSCSSKANIQHTPFRRLANSKVSSLWSCSLCPLGQFISKSKLKGSWDSKRHFQVPGLGASCGLGSCALSHCALDQRWVLHFQLASVGLSNETEVQHLSLESALQAKGAASSQT